MSKDYVILFDVMSDLYAVMVSWYMCDRMADESSTLKDTGTEEFVESMKNKNIQPKTFSDHKTLMKSLHNYEGFRAVDGIPMTELYKLLKTIFMTVK